MAQATALPRPLCQTLARLGVTAEESAAYLAPQLRDLLPDPRSLKDMETAATRFLQAVERHEKIAIFADYDVDGGTSAALLIDWLRQMGLAATLYIPDRIDEGYGPNEPAMADLAARLKEAGVREVTGAFIVWGGALPQLTHPVAVGYAAGRMSLPLELTARMYLQAFASNLVSAAVRLVPLGQTEGQACLAALAPVEEQVVAKSRGMDLDDLASSAFLSDVAAMRHETLEHRIFRS